MHNIPTMAEVNPTPLSTVRAPHDGYFEEVSRLRVILHSLSLGLLFVAGLLWIIVWSKTNMFHPYRYITFLVAIFFAIVCHVTGLVTQLVEAPTGAACRSVVVINSFANLVLYTFILLYAGLCVAVAMRRLSSGPRFYFIILVAIGMPLLVVGLETTLDLIFHPDTPCEYFHLSSTYHWFTRAPKTILLLGAICIIGVLFYWLFCFDNEVFKNNRDFLLIRHSSVTLFLLVVYCLFVEVYELAYLNLKSSKSAHWDVLVYGHIMTLLESSRGIYVAFMLCFLDLEVLSLVPGCVPCVPDLRDTNIDDAWESRIRSESMVRFVTDKEGLTSSDDGSELRPKGKVTYGTLVEEGEEEQR